jgi:hypothetical protein
MMNAEGVDRVIFIPFTICAAAGLTSPTDLMSAEQRVVTYMVQTDGRLRATELGMKGSQLPQPKVLDRAKDGSWIIYKLDADSLYRVTRPGQPDDDFGTLAGARNAVDKVIVPPQVVGGKTNDPKVSQQMQQPKGQVSSPTKVKKAA